MYTTLAFDAIVISRYPTARGVISVVQMHAKELMKPRRGSSVSKHYQSLQYAPKVMAQYTNKPATHAVGSRHYPYRQGKLGYHISAQDK